jgi:uridine kinase
MKLTKELIKLEKGSIIMISGFGGSGKSTLSEQINQTLQGIVITVDDFYTEQESYHQWDNYDFDKLIQDVILPYIKGEDLKYQAYNWGNQEEELLREYTHKEYLIIEGVGLFKEDILQYGDYSIWIDCDIETAVSSGKKRDKELYHVDFDYMWDTIWKQNDLECFDLTKPLLKADYIFPCPIKNS